MERLERRNNGGAGGEGGCGGGDGEDSEDGDHPVTGDDRGGTIGAGGLGRREYWRRVTMGWTEGGGGGGGGGGEGWVSEVG